uniref:Uncharacterized protein n=1 Tax=Arundo donax TaxID=35708 RepID=A0A0A8YRG9_ARUDO
MVDMKHEYRNTERRTSSKLFGFPSHSQMVP